MIGTLKIQVGLIVKVNCANYQTISYDAALRVIKNFPNDKKLIDKVWAKHFAGHIYSGIQVQIKK